MESTSISIEERADAFTSLLKKILQIIKPTGDSRCCLEMNDEMRPLCEKQAKHIHSICDYLLNLYVWAQQTAQEKMEKLESELIRLERENEALKKATCRN